MFPWWCSGEESACDAGDTGSIPGSGLSPGGGTGAHSSVLARENPMDRGAWQAAVHGVTKNPTELNN